MEVASYRGKTLELVQYYRPVSCEMKNETAADDSAGGWGQEWWQTGGREEGRYRGRTDSGWSPHHSLGNKPAVYGQLLICWVIIPFNPQLNQQQNNTLHKRRKAAGPHHSTEHSAERERREGETSNMRETAAFKGGEERREGKDHSIKMKKGK